MSVFRAKIQNFTTFFFSDVKIEKQSLQLIIYINCIWIVIGSGSYPASASASSASTCRRRRRHRCQRRNLRMLWEKYSDRFSVIRQGWRQFVGVEIFDAEAGSGYRDAQNKIYKNPTLSLVLNFTSHFIYLA